MSLTVTTRGGWDLASHEFINVLQGLIWVLVLEPLWAQFLHGFLELLKGDSSILALVSQTEIQ